MKLYYDLMSQPSRAVYIFMKTTKIPFEDCKVDLRNEFTWIHEETKLINQDVHGVSINRATCTTPFTIQRRLFTRNNINAEEADRATISEACTEKKILGVGEHFADEYAEINPFRLVPVIDDGGFKLTESVAILRYLSRKYNVADHWYPKDLKVQARVDEYLEWQHLNTRINCAMYFQHKFLRPKMFGTKVNEKQVEQFFNRMETTLEQFETIWLKNNKPFLCGDQISIADVLAACELEQPSMAGYDVYEGRPLLAAWYKRVKDILNPHYNEGHKVVQTVREKFGGVVPAAKL